MSSIRNGTMIVLVRNGPLHLPQHLRRPVRMRRQDQHHHRSRLDRLHDRRPPRRARNHITGSDPTPQRLLLEPRHHRIGNDLVDPERSPARRPDGDRESGGSGQDRRQIDHLARGEQQSRSGRRPGDGIRKRCRWPERRPTRDLLHPYQIARSSCSPATIVLPAGSGIGRSGIQAGRNRVSGAVG